MHCPLPKKPRVPVRSYPRGFSWPLSGTGLLRAELESVGSVGLSSRRPAASGAGGSLLRRGAIVNVGAALRSFVGTLWFIYGMYCEPAPCTCTILVLDLFACAPSAPCLSVVVDRGRTHPQLHAMQRRKTQTLLVAYGGHALRIHNRAPPRARSSCLQPAPLPSPRAPARAPATLNNRGLQK